MARRWTRGLTLALTLTPTLTLTLTPPLTPNEVALHEANASPSPAPNPNEVALHEALLASPHRTLDPEAADFYFVPSCGGGFQP